MDSNLRLRTVEVENNDVLTALAEFGQEDNDFNGGNGEDYLWDKAKGFESNLDYTLELTSHCTDAEDTINMFFETWLGSDNYYEDYDYTILYDENDNIIAISLAYTA